MTQTMKAAEVAIRNLAATDLPWLVALNNAAVPAVSDVTEASAAKLVAEAASVRVLADAGLPVAVLVGFLAGADYHSTNYKWFEANEEGFFYIDRVVVEPSARNRGLGAVLYEDAAQEAKRLGATSLACEVNEDPPNPGSMRFHTRLGFERRVSRINEGDGKRVAMLVKPL